MEHQVFEVVTVAVGGARLLDAWWCQRVSRARRSLLLRPQADG